MAKFQFGELIGTTAVTARIGAGSGSANNVDDKEVGKFVKLVGDSQYNLCAAGDQIEGYVNSMEVATMDGYSIGSVVRGGRKTVICDGLQATPGTGALAIGDYVVCGTVTAKGTAITYPKVCKATTQTGMYFPWRVVAFKSGNGAVGDLALIERVGTSV